MIVSQRLGAIAVCVIAASLGAGALLKVNRYTAVRLSVPDTATSELQAFLADYGWQPLPAKVFPQGMPLTSLRFARSGCARPAELLLLGVRPELQRYAERLLGSDAVFLTLGRQIVGLAPKPDGGDCSPPAPEHWRVLE